MEKSCTKHFFACKEPHVQEMMLYLMIPALLWAASLKLLSTSRGEKGFNIFFWQFLLIGLEAVAALLLLNYFQVSNGNRIVMMVVGGHTVGLFLFSLSTYAWARLRGKAA
jgi:hypothetical protein